ncbi:MAG: hypothetical protein EA428_16170 [Spirochaetaceae bacterium]|nr:MAG: hypothetical protein EA428_16170 [Spirochaetaceae bacterium]
MKTAVIMGIIFALGVTGIPVYGQNLLAAVYPGAIENRPSSEQGLAEFLTRDSIAEVVSFYRRQPGFPEPEGYDERGGGAAFWIRPDMDDLAYSKMGVSALYAGVAITSVPACATRRAVLTDLDRLVRSEELPAEELDRLRRRFDGLGGASLNTDQMDGRRPVNQVMLVYRQYEPAAQRLHSQLQQAREARQEEIRIAQAARNKWDAEENERLEGMRDVEQRRMELIMQGRIAEAMALPQDMADDMQRRQAGDRPVGPSVPRGPSAEQQRIAQEILAHWERALEEMSPLWYPVSITILYRR